ncbi:hypothetical protein [Rhizobium sp. TH2]|uniref:glucosamine inositolphosphorylceramide transferase family protein n=1 Tax=Rhizobium sp. TH2 TaxID=2775403 RepID=UPI0021586D66|nr:hypothetical protein [Rhizobium sp. TH2]
MTHRLRIGIVFAQDTRRENWQIRIVNRLRDDPRYLLAAELVYPRGFPQRREPRLFGVLSRLERAILAREPELETAQFDDKTLQVQGLYQAGNHELFDAGLAQNAITRLGLDLVIRMVPEPLPESVVALLPLGEWSFSYSAQQTPTADWTGFSDIVNRQPSTAISLNVRLAGKEIPIAAGAFNLKFSAARNAGFVKERAVTMLMRELGRLHATGALHAVEAPPQVDTEPPSGMDIVRYSAGLATNLLRRFTKAFKARTGIGSTVWTLFIGDGDITNFDPSRAVEIPSSRDEIRADPFLFDHEGETYLFYEAYAAGARKAHIAVGRLEGNELTPMGIALEKEHHLSYPFIFRHDGQIFMMPETNQARRIEIWRCVEFPHKWELYSTALEGQSPADSALIEHAGEWWLFTNLSDFHAYEDHCSELHVFKVDGPTLREVVPHRCNPVVIDGTTARNAGRLFSTNGKLYRPSQRNEHGIYGYGLNIMEIDRLNLDAYEERCARTIVPDFKPGLMGCHHFDATGGRFVIDARLGD